MINSSSISTSISYDALRFFQLRSGFENVQVESLTVDLLPGQHLALSGASGCGKSSLLQVIAGLKAPQNGSFNYQQQGIDSGSLPFWRQQICYLPQQPVMGADTVLEVLLLPWHMKAMQSPHVKPTESDCLQALTDAGLIVELDKDVVLLSGGEKQRLAIARAVMMQRSVWLMDEPTSALDPMARDKIISLVKALNVICISVSHDPVWLATADQVHNMDIESGIDQ
ncbi:ABC transporter [Photobacterium sp. NCIMB 13483]|uniref:Putative ABC transporter ATP-binding protein YbbL n=1 Tax=Photobacterium piscicola TaxID=1378299 RepID=A0A1T5HXC7_9GAMM|nr:MULTISPECIES: ATP-binding cassette domain-containing protein [Photobacterium]PST91606.1 ABC transporter [Photobacterium sp. NCIMB 13483]SKC31557.1 putative ABC transporter ATP-binding protein YbbL [Photobacterium piscicola]